MTQRQLADISTVGIRTIRDLESGRTHRPHPETIRLLRKTLGLAERPQAAVTHEGGSRPDGDSCLPPQIGGIIGRDSTVDTLCDLIGDGHRALVVMGFAGVGKTRLAAEVATRMGSASTMTIHWISSGGEHHPGPGFGPSDVRQPALVVLDNAAPGSVSRFAAPLSRHPHVRFLVTTRHPLGIPGERVFPLPPLGVPERDPGPTAPGDAAALSLLLQFVRRVRPAFEMNDVNRASLHEMCRLLDGIPSLLHAAAAALLVFDPDVLVDCLRVHPADMLWDLAPELAEAARVLVRSLDDVQLAHLRQLASLPGDWSAEEAADLVGMRPFAFARSINRLLELGLIRPSFSSLRTRFQVLELVRVIGLSGARQGSRDISSAS